MADPLTLAAVGWGISTAGWIISPVVTKLVNYCASSLGGFDASKKLRDLETFILPRLVVALEALEKSRRHELENLVRELKSVLYEVEDILDEAEYCRLEKQVSRWKKDKKRKFAACYEAGPSNQVSYRCILSVSISSGATFSYSTQTR